MASDDDPETKQVVARRDDVGAELTSRLRRIADHEPREPVFREVADRVAIHRARSPAVDAEIDVGVVPEIVVANRGVAAIEHREPIGPYAADAVGLFGLPAVVVE